LKHLNKPNHLPNPPSSKKTKKIEINTAFAGLATSMESAAKTGTQARVGNEEGINAF